MNFVDAADIPLEQHADENDASGEDTQEDEENNEEPNYPLPIKTVQSSHNTIYPRKGTVFANFWQLLSTFDNNFCQILTTFDNFWQLMAT